jgi:effector-binding domain-containing protein
VASATPAGPAATVTHFGAYNRMGPAHAAILEWCKAKGHRLAGPSWEVYGHWQQEWNDNPSLIQTDIFYLLEPHGHAG